MEHEVYVPFPVGSVRAALAERERVARCVPGLQLDTADTTHVADVSGSSAALEASDITHGRLRVRIGGSTITYRGSLTVTPRGEEFTVEGSGTEARGEGSVRFDLGVVARRSREGDGTRLVFTGSAWGDGRLARFEEKTSASAGVRLLDRFGAALGDSIGNEPPRGLDAPDAPAVHPVEPEDPAKPADGAGGTAQRAEREGPGGIGEPGDNERAIPGIPAPETGDSDGGDGVGDAQDGSDDGSRAQDAPAEPGPPDAGDSGEAAGDSAQDRSRTPEPESDPGSEPGAGSETGSGSERERGHTGVFDTEVPPSSLGPDAEDADEDADESAGEEAEEGEYEGGATAAEAAHARRTMIGRSAEEVDHAPPRGRYAPVPVAPPLAGVAVLRWAGPAAAVVVAGAVVIGRALRRRR